tara:strand:- start:898 stop:1041 length:144 start_codon:yes stop_codon:yes gene_type:complete
MIFCETTKLNKALTEKYISGFFHVTFSTLTAVPVPVSMRCTVGLGHN